MSDAREALRRIAVVGDWQVGVLAAISLKRALPQAEVAVIAGAAPPDGFADRATTALPFTSRLHRRLGVDETDLVRCAGASHRLVTRLIGWGGAGQSGVFSHGGGERVEAGFGERWGGGSRSEAGAAALSFAEVLAQEGRFDPAAAPQVEYGLRWNGKAYRAVLIDIAQRLGIAYVPHPVEAMESDSEGGAAAIALRGGQRVGADLFVDCCGTLVSRLADMRVDDWSAYLPLPEIAYGETGPPIVALEDRAHMLDGGWMLEIAGRDGMQRITGGAARLPDAVRETVALSPGALAKPWRGNIVALGDAAARFEPLFALPLDLAHRQIDLLLEMLPGRTIAPQERDEYNRRAALMADGVRDTLGQFYAAPAAMHVLGEQRRSDNLARQLDQFTRRGRMPFAEEAPLLTAELRALL
ncbi:MAG: tryptophan 7-halogenase, partial [Alteraurantiacibacter sp.]